MSDTKKEWKNLTKGEKFARFAIPAVCILFLLVAQAWLWWIPQPNDGIDNIYMYNRTHPSTVFDYLGMIFIYACCFWLSGLWQYLPFISEDDDDNTVYGKITVIAWVLGVAGCLIIYLL